MSDFKAKNLTYDKKQPAFLQRLKAEYAGDKNNVQFARPNKSRLKTGDEGEDDPAIVDETGESVGREVWEEMLRKEKEGDREGKGDGAAAEVKEAEAKDEMAREESRDGSRQKVAEVGAGKKRKVVKVIGDGRVNESSRTQGFSETHGEKEGGQKAKGEDSAKLKKRAKKIKLSFDDPGD
jgi:Domain of unknown function (DUF4604)